LGMLVLCLTINQDRPENFFTARFYTENKGKVRSFTARFDENKFLLIWPALGKKNCSFYILTRRPLLVTYGQKVKDKLASEAISEVLARVVKCLATKCEALSSKPSNTHIHTQRFYTISALAISSAETSLH
jgi:hypothetical protein